MIVRTFVIKDICELSTLNSSITNQPNQGTIVGGDIQSIVVQGGDVIVFTRTITIKDNTAPTSVPPTVADVCHGAGGFAHRSEVARIEQVLLQGGVILN